MAAKKGANVLFYKPNRTTRILLIPVMLHAGIARVCKNLQRPNPTASRVQNPTECSGQTLQAHSAPTPVVAALGTD
jgi:hypothetical protein